MITKHHTIHIQRAKRSVIVVVLGGTVRVVSVCLGTRIVSTGNGGSCAGGTVGSSERKRILHLHHHIALHSINRALLFRVHATFT